MMNLSLIRIIGFVIVVALVVGCSDDISGKYVEKYELKLKTKESIPQSKDWVTTEHDFGENVTLSPGKTLDILYKPKDQTFFRAVSMMCASTLFIIILLL